MSNLSESPNLRPGDSSSPPNSPPRTTGTGTGTRPRSGTQNLVEDSLAGAPWRRPSIRIRRLPSQQSGLRPRDGSDENGQASTALGRPVSGAGSDSRDFAATNLTLPTGGNLSTRPRAGSTGRNRLRHETRDLNEEIEGNRRRSNSDPLRSWNATHDERGQPRRIESYMPNVEEEQARIPVADAAQWPTLQVPNDDTNRNTGGGIGRRLSTAGALLRFPSFRPSSAEPLTQQEQYDEDLIDVLDTVDPEISTLNTLNNVQNSLFVPDLGRYLNRRPTYTLSRFPTRITEQLGSITNDAEKVEEEEEAAISRMQTMTSMTSRIDDTHFAVLPHGERLRGWSKADREELNDHVRHLMHSRKEGFKRSMRGFGQYVQKPLGFFVTLYATLITLFGLAWVLFLIGWINVGGRKDYLVNVIDNVLVALFAIIGDGLAPFRAIDTYHMCFIAHYHHLTWRLRRERTLPKLKNKNDLPALTVNDQADVETGEEKLGEFSVLNPQQQKRLVHHQKKFSRSHTFYKPHETETHFAFPLRLLVAVVVLLDCHSLLQIALGTCTWAISYHVRPFALTTVILCCSITCNITAGVLISVGDKKTRKKDVLERMFRQQLTAEAIGTLEKRKEKEKRRTMELERETGVNGMPSPTIEGAEAGVVEKRKEKVGKLVKPGSRTTAG